MGLGVDLNKEALDNNKVFATIPRGLKQHTILAFVNRKGKTDAAEKKILYNR